MISPLDSQPLNLVMEMLENIAKRHNIPFNIDLINFADDIYKIAYERGAEDEREACAGLCDRFANRMMSAEECADAIRARGQA
jgi:hypothetical protein